MDKTRTASMVAVVSMLVLLVIVNVTGASAHPAEAPPTQDVRVVNPVSEPVPVAAQGTTPVSITGTPTVNVANLPATQQVAGTVSVGNFPATQQVAGTVSVGNFPATQQVAGTVNVGNLPAVQRVEVVNEEGSLVRGSLDFRIDDPTPGGPSLAIPAGVVLTDIIGFVSAGNRADCNLLISDASGLLLRARLPNLEIATIDLQSGLVGPLTLGTSMGGFDDSFCSGHLLWTGTSD